MSNATKSAAADSTKTVPTTAVAQQSDNVAHALAGAGGGILSTALTYPLITLSTRAQVESRKADTSTVQAVKAIIAREGILGLYAGIDSALFGIGVTNFVYYYWYEWTRSFFEAAAIKAGRATKKLTTLESMMAGAVAGSLTVLITNPIWVVNTRMTAPKQQQQSSSTKLGESQSSKPPSTIGTFLQIIQDEGFSGFFAGVKPALVLVINPILQYTVFEQLKNVVEKRRRITPTDAFYLGALGKLVATSVTYPYITVKSRMHVAGKGNKDDMATTFKNIINTNGIAGLYAGIGSKVSQSVITAALLFAFKDALYDVSVNLRKKVAQK